MYEHDEKIWTSYWRNDDKEGGTNGCKSEFKIEEQEFLYKDSSYEALKTTNDTLYLLLVNLSPAPAQLNSVWAVAKVAIKTAESLFFHGKLSCYWLFIYVFNVDQFGNLTL